MSGRLERTVSDKTGRSAADASALEIRRIRIAGIDRPVGLMVTTVALRWDIMTERPGNAGVGFSSDPAVIECGEVFLCCHEISCLRWFRYLSCAPPRPMERLSTSSAARRVMTA